MDSSNPWNDPSAPAPPGPGDAPRRDFLTQALAASLGAAVGLGPIAAGVYVALDPLRKKRVEGVPFLPVAPLEAVEADGLPHLFRVLGTLTDAWTRYPRVPIGAVYLRRTKEKPEEVQAFHPTCPHLGCFVSSRGDGTYHCPCHDSDFREDGSIGNPQSPSPRGLDRLLTRIEDGKILVQFLNFETGLKEPRPIA